MTEPILLTKFAKRAGCAAKQPPGFLLPLLQSLPVITDPNVLVGTATADDAAIYRLNDELALVLTTDFFTPVVDRPYDFGAVAAANALSDVYAMGGKPLTALSIVGFPDTALPPEVLVEILRGAADKAAEAGIAIVGGHTIRSEEPIFGLAVVGTIAPWAPVLQGRLGGEKGDDSYRIARVEKKEGGKWSVVSVFVLRDKQMEFPISASVKFAGDTAVLILDNVRAAPGKANWSARVMFHDDVYAGRWWETANKEHGGTIAGTMTREEKKFP